MTRSVQAVMLAWLSLAAGCRATAPEIALPPSTFTIESKVLGETRRINVYIPPDYRLDTASYPVLYMPDGGLQEDFPHITAAIDAAIRDGAIPPFVVVGIENTERRRDLTGPTTVDSDREIAPRVGGSAAFREFLRDELRPAISACVRTTGETALVGESLAGLFVVETFLLEPSLFDTCIAVSPSLWWNGGELVRTAGELLRNGARAGTTLFLTSAGDDIAPSTAELAEVLRREAIPGLVWQHQPRPDLQHATIFRAMAPIAFRTVFATSIPVTARADVETCTTSRVPLSRESAGRRVPRVAPASFALGQP